MRNLLKCAALYASVALALAVVPKCSSALAAPAFGQSNAQQGNCAIVFEASPVGNEGSIVYFGAAWGRATLEDAQGGAKDELLKHMNGVGINPDVGGGGGPEPGIMVVASGCDAAHGAVVGVPGDDDTYNNYYSALSDTTDEATSNAVERCRNRLGPGMTYSGECRVVLQW
jgi:hypothetical protein